MLSALFKWLVNVAVKLDMSQADSSLRAAGPLTALALHAAGRASSLHSGCQEAQELDFTHKNMLRAFPGHGGLATLLG